jgi:protein-disulfide isomerase
MIFGNRREQERMRSTDLVFRALLVAMFAMLAACATPGGQTPVASGEATQQASSTAAQDGPAQAPSAAKPAPAPVAKKPLTISFGGAPVMGDPHAKVAMIEFGDFQGRHSRYYHRMTFQRIKHKYVDHGQIQYRFRDFPLPIHKQARDAAIAAHCAGEQGAYWAMLHNLFDSNARLGPDLYKKNAKVLKVEVRGFRVRRFNRCLTDGSQDATIDANIKYGQTLKIDGTPTFFIGTVEGDHITNVKRLSGALPFRDFQQALDQALKESGSTN